MQLTTKVDLFSFFGVQSASQKRGHSSLSETEESSVESNAVLPTQAVVNAKKRTTQAYWQGHVSMRPYRALTSAIEWFKCNLLITGPFISNEAQRVMALEAFQFVWQFQDKFELPDGLLECVSVLTLSPQCNSSCDVAS